MIHSFLLTPPSSHIKNGTLRLKRQIGASWAGRIINNQTPGRVVPTQRGTIRLKGNDIIRSRQTQAHVAAFSMDAGTVIILAFNDSSALLLKKEGTSAKIHADGWYTILPLPLYLPKTIVMDSKTHDMTIADWLDPAENNRFTLEQARALTAQLIEDANWWHTYAQTLDPIKMDLETGGLTPWFSPLRTAQDSDIKTLGTYLKALSMLGSGKTLELMGRTLNAKGNISAASLICRGCDWWTKEKLRYAATLFDTLSVPVDRQIAQGFLPGKTTGISGFGAMTLLRSSQVTAFHSAHDRIQAFELINPHLSLTTLETL